MQIFKITCDLREDVHLFKENATVMSDWSIYLGQNLGNTLLVYSQYFWSLWVINGYYSINGYEIIDVKVNIIWC